jgi:hypothetical protein
MANSVIRTNGTEIRVTLGSGGIVRPNDAVVLKNVINDVRRLDGLQDVIEGSGAANNATLVYNSDTDKYEVQQLNLDGGTF